MTETGFVPQARYMMRALDLAKQASAMGEVPSVTVPYIVVARLI